MIFCRWESESSPQASVIFNSMHANFRGVCGNNDPNIINIRAALLTRPYTRGPARETQFKQSVCFCTDGSEPCRTLARLLITFKYQRFQLRPPRSRQLPHICCRICGEERGEAAAAALHFDLTFQRAGNLLTALD